jgi:hypothetical protein
MLGRFKAVILDDFPMFAAPWLMSGLVSMIDRSGLVNMVPAPANVVISNVPGAPVPLYFAGAKMTCFYPVSMISHGIALNITVHSYNGRMDYGFIACRRALPDVNDLADYLLAEHRVLLGLAQQAAAAAAAEAVLVAAKKKVKAKSTDTQVAAPEAAPAKRAKAKKPVVRKTGDAKPAAAKAIKPAVRQLRAIAKA